MSRKSLHHLKSDFLPLIGEVALESAHAVDGVMLIDVVEGVPVPLCESCECDLIVQTAHQEDYVSTAVVVSSERLKLFSVCCVYYCQLVRRSKF